MKRFVLVAGAILLLALLAGLWWKRDAQELPREGAPAIRAVTGTSTETASTPAPDPAAVVPAVVGTKTLHGLRLLPTEIAVSRGWKPPPPASEDSDPARVAQKRWRLTELKFVSNNKPIEDLLAEIEQNYGLHVRIDPQISLEGHSFSMAANGMTADHTLKLLAKMHEVAFAIDVAGDAWLTTAERAKAIAAPPEPLDDPWRKTAGMIRWEIELGRGPDGKWPGTPPSAPTWKDRKVTVAIVRKPLEEALGELGDALGIRRPMRLAYFNKDATELAASLQPVSLVATDMPAEQAIDELLRGTGLTMELDSGDYGRVKTIESVEKKRVLEEAIKRQLGEEAAETAALRLRRVRITGEVLTAGEVALQVGAQLGITVRLSEEVGRCAELWESDGLEQSAGEVLDILARDGSLLWRWQGEYDGTSDLHVGPRCLWVIGKAEK
jgi:hypothetical protein